MAYFIQKQSLIDSNITVFYIGNNRWSDDDKQKVTFASEEEANQLMINSDGKNGGWSNAIIVSE